MSELDRMEKRRRELRILKAAGDIAVLIHKPPVPGVPLTVGDIARVIQTEVAESLEQENRELREENGGLREENGGLSRSLAAAWESKARLYETARARAQAAEDRLAQVSEPARQLCSWIRHILPSWTSEVDKYLEETEAALTTPPNRQESARLTRMVENIRGECERSERLTADDYNARVTPEAAAPRPATAPQMYVCNKCGYVGESISHKGCNYNATWAPPVEPERPATALAPWCGRCGTAGAPDCPECYPEPPAGEELPTLCAHGRLDECCPDCVRGTDAR